MRKCKCYYCKELITIEENLIKYNVSNTEKEINKNFHKECLDKFITEMEIKNIEQKEWDELYFYVKKEILNYSDNMNLSSYLVLRLKGFKIGNYIAQKNSKISLNENGYPYKIILLTFKIKKLDITKALKTIDFSSENHKINYIMTIISNSINDVYLRVKEKKKASELLENIKIIIPNENEQINFVNKTDLTKNKVANVLNDLF